MFENLPEPRKWQLRALDLWNRSSRRGIVEVVTGGGKTLLAMYAIRQWLNGAPSSAQVLVIVPTTALQDQWLVTLTVDAGISRGCISVWPSEKATDRQFQIMVVNTARSNARLLERASEAIFVVADECHRYGSIENSRAIDIRSDASLGLTATAEREYDDALYKILIPNLGPVIYQYSLLDALRDGVITPFRLMNVQTDLNADETLEYSRLTKSLSIALSQGDEEKAQSIAMRRSMVSKRAVSRIPTAVALTLRSPRTKTLIFHEDIESANLIVNLLRKHGVRALAYHSKIGVDMRRDNLRMFKEGQIDSLVACRALDEGLDVPGAERAILVASTSSTRQRIQRIGRVLRRSSGKDMAEVITIYATDAERNQLAEESQGLEEVAEVKWLEVVRK